MQEPIQIIKHYISDQPRKGAGGVEYVEKKYSVKKGSSRINAALLKGYNAIEGIIVESYEWKLFR